jgi:hypothetical protein
MPAEPLPELVNKPTGNAYFDRMLKSDVGMKFLELTDSHDRVKPVKDIGEAPAGKTSPLNTLASCLSVVVLKEDGSHSQQSLTFNAPVEAATNADSASLDDTLTQRSSPGAVAAAVRSLLESGVALHIGEPTGSASDSHAALDQAASERLAVAQDQAASSRELAWDIPPLNFQQLRNMEGKPEIVSADILSGPPAQPEQESCPEADSKAQPQSESKSREQLESELDGLAAKLPEDADRAAWQIGSVIEVFSASAGRWFPAIVTQVMVTKSFKEMITAQFWLSIDDAKQKTLCRQSELLASLGAHCGDQLPPGFQIAASKSRPGAFVFLDATTGLKYESLELIWTVHFKRWLDQSESSGIETISSVAAAVSSTHAATLDMPVDGEAAGLVTRMVQDSEPERVNAHLCEPAFTVREAAITVRDNLPSSSAMGLSAGFEEDIDAWAPWMQWAEQRPESKEIPAPASPSSTPHLSRPDPNTPCTEAANLSKAVPEELSSSPSLPSGDCDDGAPDEEFIFARLTESIMQEFSPSRLQQTPR